MLGGLVINGAFGSSRDQLELIGPLRSDVPAGDIDLAGVDQLGNWLMGDTWPDGLAAAFNTAPQRSFQLSQILAVDEPVIAQGTPIRIAQEPAPAVAEPNTMLLFGTGVAGYLWALRWRREREVSAGELMAGQFPVVTRARTG